MKFKFATFIFLQLAFSIAFLCFGNTVSAQKTKNNKLLIAFSKATNSESYQAYTKWIKNGDSSITCVNLYGEKPEDAIAILEKCSGLVLTGGPDVNPAYYGKTNDSSRCEIDPYRDSLEFSLIQKAMQMELPIIAICRGEQILNVYMGGSLIVDIPEDFDTIVNHRTSGGYNAMHYIKITENTLLCSISGQIGDSVNTNHHQAVDVLASCFTATAFANDGIIEAYEWKHKAGKPFLLAVQWHPERLTNAASLKIRNYFVLQAFDYFLNKQYRIP